MIAFVEGQFIPVSPACVIVNVNGVGYEVNISLHTYNKIHQLEKGRLLTYLRISENEHSLFGFFDTTERTLFIQLISVSGVGASTARLMLSGMPPEDLGNAIVRGDERVLGTVKGIGPKTAKRIILELKDKIMLIGSVSPTNMAVSQNNIGNDALNALVSLGIAKNIAAEAVRKTLDANKDNNDVQQIIKLALKNL
jgi:holliday junction DNA helicase RuvA